MGISAGIFITAETPAPESITHVYQETIRRGSYCQADIILDRKFAQYIRKDIADAKDKRIRELECFIETHGLDVPPPNQPKT